MTLPTLDLVRRATDRQVLDALLVAEQLTRAELAARTGISKPTISESVRRLAAAGLLTGGGAQTGGRGRAGTYVRLDPALGLVLAAAVGPEGIVATTLDPRGTPLRRAERPVPFPAAGTDLGPRLVAAVEEVGGPVLAAAVSLAGPVAQPAGRLVALPDSPFVLGDLDARTLLAGLPGLTVDNDVNWAALAEHRAGAATDLTDFAYVYLGPGLGAAVVSGGRVQRGAGGLAGEIAHVRTTGPHGASMRLVDCFAGWGLRRPGAAAIDLDRLRDVLTGSDPGVAEGIEIAVAGVVTGLIAVLNPAGVLLGGPWSTTGGIGDRIAARVRAEAVVPTVVRAAALGADAPLLGAQFAAVDQSREALLARVP